MNARDRLALALLLDAFFGGPPDIDPDGTHKHECPDCGCIWEHPNSRAGDEDAHTCPACKTLMPSPWWHYDGDASPCYVEGPNGLPMAA